MSLSQILKEECSICHKVAIESSRLKIGKTTLVKLVCGHLQSEKSLTLEESSYSSLIFSDGSKPRDYQIEAIKFLESCNINGIIADEQGLGKGQILSDKILTPNGFKEFRSININDSIIGKDGLIYTVTNIYDRGILPVYKVTFNDDSFVTVDGEHLWSVESHNDRVRNLNRYKTIDTLKLKSLIEKNSWLSSKSYYYIPTVKSIQFENKEVNIDPYQLGILIGDGTLTQFQVGFTSIDDEIINSFSYIRKSDSHNNDVCTYYLDITYKIYLNSLGLYGKKSESKFIPDIYKFNSESVRLNILQGLMDSDGSIWNNNVVEYTTSSEQLKEDVVFLVNSLGGTCKVSTKIPKYKYKGELKKGKLSYKIVINIPINPFRLTRKAAKWKKRSKYLPQRAIKSIEFVGEEKVKCISVNSPDNLYVTNNCIVTHNTIEFLCTLKLHPEKLLPAVLVVPSTVKVQWLREIIRICGNGGKFLTQVISSGNELALPGFGIYVVTYDLLKKENMFSLIPEIKTLMLDECQRVKNHLSDRAKAVQVIAERCSHIVPMSGTPIKNNAGEYFTVLNLVAPKRFPNFQSYLNRYVDAESGQFGIISRGLRDSNQFHEDTKDIIIRRTKNEVLKDLPPLDRKFQHVELDPSLNKAYAKALEELDDLVYSDMEKNAFESGNLMIAIMSKLRHIVGISKVPDCVEFVTEFLLSSERKLVIFVHHQDVADILKLKLNSYLKDGAFEECLFLNSQLDALQRANLVEKFEKGNSRILIASTLAAGEGLNLQFCSDAVILERQWNPANEEQAEARFHRFGQKNNVSITYLLAISTIDEYFTELVEKKRAIVASALDNKQLDWNEQGLMKELATLLVTKGRKKWSL